jgi:hypothetical protein
MSLKQLEALKPVAVLSAARFFTELLPPVLARRAETLKKLGGTYGFRVHGEGDWVIDFSSSTILRTGFETADLQIETRPAELQKLLQGTLDVQAAYADGSFDMRGRRSRFFDFTAGLRN